MLAGKPDFALKSSYISIPPVRRIKVLKKALKSLYHNLNNVKKNKKKNNKKIDLTFNDVIGKFLLGNFFWGISSGEFLFLKSIKKYIEFYGVAQS